MLLVAAISLGAACQGKSAAGAQSQVLPDPIGTSYFDEGKYSRTICAYENPNATYYVAITVKDWKPGDDAGPCVNFTENMTELGPNDISWELCANLGLEFKELGGGIDACVRHQAPDVGVPLHCHTFKGWYEQLNYNVADWDGQQAVRTSGWQPPGSNGCPRDGFLW
jgi:hypothetical protein